MSKLGDLACLLVIALVVGTALWTVARDWSALLSVGGWFALVGRFLAVAAALTLLVVGLALGVGLAVAPVLLLLTATNALSERGYAYGEIVGRLRIRPRQLGVLLVRAVDPVWKASWWTWWYMRRYLARHSRRS